MSNKAVIDPVNPEWTDADFKKARPASELPADILKAFQRTRGPQKAPKKVPISIRLSQEVIDRLKADGPGWQRRIDDVLKSVLGISQVKTKPIIRPKKVVRTPKAKKVA